MATTRKELWRGTNGDAWTSSLWFNQTEYPGGSHTGTVDIQSNRGRILPSTLDASNQTSMFMRHPPVANFDLVTSIDYSVTTGNTWFAYIFVRASLDWTSNGTPTNALYFDMNSNGLLEVVRAVGATSTQLTTTTITVNAGTPTFVRFRCVGPSLKVKWWASSGNEPSGWNYETTQWDVPGPGYVALANGFGGATGFNTFGDLQFTDLTPAPPLLLGRLKRQPRKPVKPPHVLVSWSGQGTLQTDGTFAGTSTVGHKSAGTLQTDGSFTGAGKVTHKAAGTLTTGGTFTGAGVVAHKSAGTLQTNGTFAGTGKITHAASGALTTATSLVGVDVDTHHGTATFTTAGTFTGTGQVAHFAAGTLTTTSSFAGTGVDIPPGAFGSGTLSTVTTLTADGVVTSAHRDGGLLRYGRVDTSDRRDILSTLERDEEDALLLVLIGASL